MDMKATVKKEDAEPPVVELSATTINQEGAAKVAAENADLVALGNAYSELKANGLTDEDLKASADFQQFAIESIDNYINEFPLNETATLEVTCDAVKGSDDKMHWAPQNPEAVAKSVKYFLLGKSRAIFFSKGDEDMRKAIQRIFALAIFLTLALAIAACSDEPKEKLAPVTKAATFTDTYKTEDTWLVYWYLCGTDLETNYGSASTDLQELLDVKLPANVKVLIQTGGTNQWQNNVVNSGAVERYIYDASGLNRLETLPDADMGDVETLTDFIKYGAQMPALGSWRRLGGGRLFRRTHPKLSGLE